MITEIGKHRVKCSNVMNGIDDLMGQDMADLFYSDPPWGASNLKYWETMRRKMNDVSSSEERKDIPLEDFLNQIFSIGTKFSKNLVLVEYGKKWSEELIDKARSYGLRHHKTVEMLYKSGSKLLPMDLHVFSKHGITIPEGFEEAVYHTHGYNSIKTACSFFVKEDDIVLDGCCGMGYTAQVAVDFNMKFRGNELNEKRLQKTIARLEKDKNK